MVTPVHAVVFLVSTIVGVSSACVLMVGLVKSGMISCAAGRLTAKQHRNFV